MKCFAKVTVQFVLVFSIISTSLTFQHWLWSNRAELRWPARPWWLYAVRSSRTGRI